MLNKEKAIEISQNINSFWQLGSLEDKRKIQELVFPEGIVVDTKNRTYLTSKVNSLFLAKSRFKRDSRGTNKKLPIISDEESFEVAGVGLSKRDKWLIINYRFVSTFGVFEHFVSKYLYCMPLFIMYSMCHIKYRFFVSTLNKQYLHNHRV